MTSTDEVAAATGTILDELGVDTDGASVTIHEPEQPAVAAALDADGVVVGVELVDAAALPEREGITYQLLDDADREHAVVGAAWDGSTWTAPEPAPDAEPADAGDPGVLDLDLAQWRADVRRDVDATLALLLGAQQGVTPAGIDWWDVLYGMVTRGTAEEDELSGALAWKLIDAREHAQLLDLIASTRDTGDEPDEPGAPGAQQ